MPAASGIDTARCKSVFWLHALHGPIAAILLSSLLGHSVAGGKRNPRAQNRYFVTSDGVRLHYLEAGPSARPHDRLRARLDHAGLDLGAADPATSRHLSRRRVRSARPGRVGSRPRATSHAAAARTSPN